MNRIITRGMGTKHLLVTRGYGRHIVRTLKVDIINLCSCIGRTLGLVSKWKTNCA